MTETEQLDAILHGAAFAPITDRGFLRITGSDATRWLNGMVTNNINDLAPGEGNYNFLLNAQGRIQGDCTIYREPGDGAATYLLETGDWQLDTIQKTLDHFIIMDDVELTPISDLEQGVLVLGPDAAGQLLEWALPAKGVARLAEITIMQNPAWVLITGRGELPHFELHGTRDVIQTFVKGLDLPEVSEEALEAFRIYYGTPKYGIDIRDRDLPQETGQTHALHFAKGCYLGQEIVERIRSRGQVHRQFSQFRLTGSLPTLPTPLESNGKPAGELTSAAQIGDTIYALGYARREALDTNQPLTYPGGAATPSIRNGN